MLILHHLQNSRSQRIIWLLEEMGLDYELVTHEREQNSRFAPPSLKKIHPLGKAPVLCDGEIVIAESGAIVDYLLESYDSDLLPPAKTQERRFCRYWSHFGEGTLMPFLAMKLVFAAIESNTPFIIRPPIHYLFHQVNNRYLHPNLNASLAYIDKHLQQYPWFAGDRFSAADILMGFLLEAVANRRTSVITHPGIHNFIHAIERREAYHRAKQKGQWSAQDHQHYWACLAK